MEERLCWLWKHLIRIYGRSCYGHLFLWVQFLSIPNWRLDQECLPSSKGHLSEGHQLVAMINEEIKSQDTEPGRLRSDEWMQAASGIFLSQGNWWKMCQAKLTAFQPKGSAVQNLWVPHTQRWGGWGSVLTVSDPGPVNTKDIPGRWKTVSQAAPKPLWTPGVRWSSWLALSLSNVIKYSDCCEGW